MKNKYLFWLMLMPLLVGCASDNLQERLKDIDDRPFIADSIVVVDHDPVKLAPLTKWDGSQASTIMRHKQHKADRETVKAIDSALAAKNQEVRYLKQALRSVEIGERAMERANEHLKSGLERERKAAQFNDTMHRVFEAALGIALIVVAF